MSSQGQSDTQNLCIAPKKIDNISAVSPHSADDLISWSVMASYRGACIIHHFTCGSSSHDMKIIWRQWGYRIDFSGSRERRTSELWGMMSEMWRTLATNDFDSDAGATGSFSEYPEVNLCSCFVFIMFCLSSYSM